MALSALLQRDFSAGMVTSTARHLIPENGLYEAENTLLDEDGSVYRRGGSVYRSDAVFGTGGLRWIWNGYLEPGQRTIFANTADFGALDGTAPVNLGGTGLAVPTRGAVVGGLLFIGGGTIFGGSLKAADYSAGTIAVTQGSTTVSGTGTAFLANVDAGMLLRLAAGRYYVVKNVISDAQLTLTEAYGEATASGVAYTLTRLGSTTTPYRTAPYYAAAADRLIAADGNRVHFSNGRDPATGATRPHLFTDTDYHELPQGATVRGLQALRGQVLVFTSDGVWSLGNVAYDLTDPSGNVQQTLQQAGRDVILWGNAGIAEYQNALVVPATDGVYLVDGVSSPLRVSDSIRTTISDYVRAGYQPGGGHVYNSHYFLPVIDSAGTWIDLLICRLDRLTTSGGKRYVPWTRFSGHGGNVTALAHGTSTASRPELYAAGLDGRVLQLTDVFEPDAARASDADGSVHRWRIDSRDFTTGARTNRENLNLVRRVRIRYELTDAGSDNPVINGFYSKGKRVSADSLWGGESWGGFSWGDSSSDEFAEMAMTAPEDEGREPFTFHVQARTRLFRVRFESTDPAATLKLRSMEIRLRESSKDD